MRVIMSPIGSFIAIVRSSSPARLHEAGNEALGAEFPERDAAHLELAVEAARTARHLAAIADAGGRSVARQLGELQGGGEPLLHRLVLVARDRFQARAAAEGAFGHLASPIVLLDRALLRHTSLLGIRV